VDRRAPRTPGASIVATIVATAVLCAFGFATVACSGDDDSASTGPAPTNNDPGPNDTSDAPVTIQGTARLDPTTNCIVLETSNGLFALQFSDYELGNDGAPAIVATDDGRVLAHAGDTVVVTGRASPAPDPCGSGFAVESLNSVIPAAP
jgi:hypothetical protein